MGSRKIVVKESAAENIAALAWFIESKGLIATADKFTDAVYDFFIKMADKRKSYHICRDPDRSFLGYKCIPYKKKYTIFLLSLKQN